MLCWFEPSNDAVDKLAALTSNKNQFLSLSIYYQSFFKLNVNLSTYLLYVSLSLDYNIDLLFVQLAVSIDHWLCTYVWSVWSACERTSECINMPKSLSRNKCLYTYRICSIGEQSFAITFLFARFASRAQVQWPHIDTCTNTQHTPTIQQSLTQQAHKKNRIRKNFAESKENEEWKNQQRTT